jgi:class 3 adenylate cyclase
MTAESDVDARLTQEQGLLESQIQAINRFPDQNPHPVMRVSDDGVLTYANVSSEPVRAALDLSVGRPVPRELLQRLRNAAHAGSATERVEISAGGRTFALLPVPVPELGFMNIYGTDITAEKVIERFPNQNPNPVFRVDDQGTLIYANAASEPLIEAFQMRIGDRWPDEIGRVVIQAADTGATEMIELTAGVRTYAVRPVRVAEFGFINVYGTDVTAEKVVAKFPGQNPHPVLRMSLEGGLIYANSASKPIVDALGLRVGDAMPADLAKQLFASMESGRLSPIECLAGEEIFELLPVLIPEFDFVNVYGTDVTAAREVARAKDETERLLLNILPPPIADRLRRGERVIADRFEDSTLLIADIVGFTEMSSELSANQIVELLNEIFSSLDVLVDRYELEKVKTIGDAYMVIGGVPLAIDDHVGRVAEFALDLSETVATLQGWLGQKVSCRIGVNCGPVVAGVIGQKRTIYDVWGDTVNVASRMEALGAPGRVHVSPAVHERLRDRFEFEERGTIDVKGKGPMPTYFLRSSRAR